MSVAGGLCVILLAAAAAQAEPRAVKTRFPTRDVVVAEEVLTPSDKGDADEAPAIQAAVDRVSKAGGGTVFLSSGAYMIASRIVVREGVTLRGDYAAADPMRSTRLRITADKGKEDAPATFTVERGGGLVGLTFWYPEQRVPDPIPYPWTVKSAAVPANDNQTVADCTFVNSWKALCIGPESNELHTFRNLLVCALKTGLSIDSTTDIGRLSDVTVSPSVWLDAKLPATPKSADLRAYLLGGDAVAVDIGRSDWEYIWRLKVDGYRFGLVVRKGAWGTTNAVMAESDLLGCGTAFVADELNQVGFSAYRCTFEGSQQAFRDTERFDAVVQFHSCRFDGGVSLSGRGVVTFQGCALTNAVVQADGGQVQVADSAVREVKIGVGVVRARILGFDEKTAAIANACANGDVMVSARHPNAQKPRVVLPEPMAFPRPESDAVFVATDFGASEASDDNAAAFQAALDVAGAARGGGTVYVPAGLYKFRHDLVVPEGVELRGCFDVPHHTISAGSVLMAYHNRGREDGAPFVSLKSGSGLRGLTFWYPEQPLKAPVPYPWTVRSLGKRCWLTDVTIGNAWQAVDFATHRSDGHRISYLAGSMFRCGLLVGNSRGRGWVEDTQFNPHYAARLPQRLPRVDGEGPGDVGGRIIQFQREHLEGLVFRECRDEQVRGTFLYAAYDGLAFHGKSRAQVLMHGTDTGSRAAVFETASGSQVDLALAQLVSLGDWAKAAIVTLPGSKGTARFYNSQMWAGPATAALEGEGVVRLEQFNTLTGPIAARSGKLEICNGVFDLDLPAHVAVSGSAEAEVVGTGFERGALRVEGDRSRVRRFANSASARPSAATSSAPAVFASSFEADERPAAKTDEVAPRGGLRQVSGNHCGAVERDDAHSGRRALWLRGVSDDPSYSYVYQTAFDGPIAVMPDTTLTYWTKPLNENGQATGIDLLFSGGKALRETGVADSAGRPTHPGAKKGPVGAWTKVEVPLGGLAGQTIESVMAAYDTRAGGGPFEALFDDVRIASDLPAWAWQVRAEPSGGTVRRGAAVQVAKDASVQVRYTVDGSNPDASSPLYDAPIVLSKTGLVELRLAPLTADGAVSKQVFAALYAVE